MEMLCLQAGSSQVNLYKCPLFHISMTLCAILCDEGFEQVTAKDLNTRFKVGNISIEPTMVLFEGSFEECAKISYLFQSAIKVLYGVTSFEVKALESPTTISKEALEMVAAYTIAIKCVRKGSHAFNSVDFAREVSEAHFKDHSKDFKKAQIEFLAYIKNNKGYLGVDITGRVLSKRDYKIFFGPTTLRGTVAYGLLQFADVSAEDIILDPFMGSGTIVLEAALLASNTSPFFFSKEKFLFRNLPCPSGDSWEVWFDKLDEARDISKKEIIGYDSLLKYLKYTQKNAKIAEVNKIIKISKCDVDWLDTKLDEASINTIITNPPGISKTSSLRNMLRLYMDFFKQSDHLLVEGGTISAIMSERTYEFMSQAAGKTGFLEEDKHDVYEGQQELLIVTYVRDPDAVQEEDEDTDDETEGDK
jgi:23S rRNA G2445 N2-methylase RlmL